MKLLVYVPLLTPRIKYIFNFIFNDILKTQVGFSSNIVEFKSSALPKISYADTPVADEIFFRNSDFLLSYTINQPSFKTTTFGDMIVPFTVDNSQLPFDVFAASFYFVSRYEEYLSSNLDAMGNFMAEHSLQNKLKLLEFPVVDGWAMILKNILLKRYPTLYFGKKSFEFNPVICLYNEKESIGLSLFKKSAHLVNKALSLFKANRVLPAKSGGLKAFLTQEHEKYNLTPTFFLKSTAEIQQDCSPALSFPKSYLQLLKSGINKDYRMGYANTIGFRAGTCTPFFWYDLQLEKTTHLLIHPIAINDSILNNNRTFNLEEILAKWGTLIANTKLLEGHFFIVWHKESLPDVGKGKVGRRLYTQLLANNLP